MQNDSLETEVLCEKCGESYPARRRALGYKVCVACSDVQKYLGRRQQGRHDGTTEIFRYDLDNVKRLLREENSKVRK